LIIFDKNLIKVQLLKLQLKIKFKMKNVKKLRYFLKIQVYKNYKVKLFQINQIKYINTIFERFEMKNLILIFISIVINIKFLKIIKELNIIN